MEQMFKHLSRFSERDANSVKAVSIHIIMMHVKKLLGSSKLKSFEKEKKEPLQKEKLRY